MAQYTIKRNERLKDAQIQLDFNGLTIINFDGSTATADLTEDQVNYLLKHGYEVEDGSGESARIRELEEEVAALEEEVAALELAEEEVKGLINGTLEEIVIPDDITKIRGGAFNGLSSLKRVVIPDGVTFIGSSAFYNTSLTNIELPNGIDKIDTMTFGSCALLESITIPDGVESIGISAFKNCTSLQTINLPSSIHQISSGSTNGAFVGINANAVINCGFAQGAVSGAPWGASTAVTINYNVTE